jgi:hypothetical protein
VDNFVVRLLADFVNVLEGNLALLVDDKQRTLGDSISRAESSKGFGNRPFGSKSASNG